jgi:hypothetical protein
MMYIIQSTITSDNKHGPVGGEIPYQGIHEDEFAEGGEENGDDFQDEAGG